MKKLDNIKVNGLCVYANPTTNRLRIGSRGTGLPAVDMLRSMSKTNRRTIRKALYGAGMRQMAGAGIHN